MNTELDEIYDAFLQKITDYSFANDLEEDDLEDKLRGLLKSAIRNFRKCKKDLSLNDTSPTFKVELNGFEIEILANLMIVEYLTAKVISTEGLEQVLTDKDFKIYSQANQLQNVEQIRKKFKADSTKMITEYLYEGMIKK